MFTFPLRNSWRQDVARKLPRLLVALSVLCLSSTMAHAAPIVWYKDFNAASRLAAQTHKPMLVMVGAHWCGYCRQMQQQTLQDQSVAQRVTSDFVPVMIDADEQPELTQRLNASELPTVLVMSSDARVLQRMTGFQSAGQLNGQLAAYHPAQAVVRSTLPVRQFRPTYNSFWRTHTYRTSLPGIKPNPGLAAN